MHSTAQQPIFGAQLDTSVRVRDYYSIVARACIPIPGGNVQFRARVSCQCQAETLVINELGLRMLGFQLGNTTIPVLLGFSARMKVLWTRVTPEYAL